jgi:hypothetical protein
MAWTTPTPARARDCICVATDNLRGAVYISGITAVNLLQYADFLLLRAKSRANRNKISSPALHRFARRRRQAA